MYLSLLTNSWKLVCNCDIKDHRLHLRLSVPLKSVDYLQWEYALSTEKCIYCHLDHLLYFSICCLWSYAFSFLHLDTGDDCFFFFKWLSCKVNTSITVFNNVIVMCSVWKTMNKHKSNRALPVLAVFPLHLCEITVSGVVVWCGTEILRRIFFFCRKKNNFNVKTFEQSFITQLCILQ